MLATLIGDTCILRDRLVAGAGGDTNSGLLLAWLDDYALRLREVDEDLRELALSLESQRLRKTDFDVVLRDEAAAFAARTGIVVDIDVTGSFANLTASQRFAIAAVVREALANVREHGKASRARLRVCATTACIRASVTDDGRGFDVERALVAAAARTPGARRDERAGAAARRPPCRGQPAGRADEDQHDASPLGVGARACAGQGRNPPRG